MRTARCTPGKRPATAPTTSLCPSCRTSPATRRLKNSAVLVARHWDATKANTLSRSSSNRGQEIELHLEQRHDLPFLCVHAFQPVLQRPRVVLAIDVPLLLDTQVVLRRRFVSAASCHAVDTSCAWAQMCTRNLGQASQPQADTIRLTCSWTVAFANSGKQVHLEVQQKV